MPAMDPVDARMILTDLGRPPSSYVVEESLRESSKLWREAARILKELDERQRTWRVLIEWLKLAGR